MSWQQEHYDNHQFIHWSGDLTEEPWIELRGQSMDGVRFHEKLYIDAVTEGPAIGVLGMGGFGVVLAVSSRSGEQFALKTLRSSHPEQHEIERFRREQDCLTRVDHPSAVAILVQGQLVCRDGVDRPAYLMERIRIDGLGRQIELVSTTNLPDLKAVLRVGIEIADVLAAFHDLNVTHRDVKPDNLFADTTILPAPKVKLIDLGIAFDHTEPRLTVPPGVNGTMDYVDHDQVRGIPSSRSDQFALGVLLYRWSTGRFPFLQCVDFVTFLASIAERDPQKGTDPPLASTLNPLVGDHFSRVLARMLSRDSTLRFPTMRDVEAQFLLILGETPIHRNHWRDERHPYHRITKLVPGVADRVLREFDRLHTGLLLGPIRIFIDALSRFESEAYRSVGQKPVVSALFALQASFRGAKHVFLEFGAVDSVAQNEWLRSKVLDELDRFEFAVRKLSKRFPSGQVLDDSQAAQYAREVVQIIRPMRRKLRHLDLQLRCLLAGIDSELGIFP